MPISEPDLNEVVRQVVRQGEPVADAKGIVLRADVQERPALAVASEAGVRRLLLTLVDDALRHTANGGTITVSTTLNDGRNTRRSRHG